MARRYYEAIMSLGICRPPEDSLVHGDDVGGSVGDEAAHGGGDGVGDEEAAVGEESE